ncbi:MAG: hypothetical protein IJ035_05130 [Oscillospiraceae bacterium]|nr:hypothetical protein [Oscillospiraceae bacterium]
MGLLDKLLGKNKPTLEDDIHSACTRIVTALNTSGYNADYTLESMKEIDRFFDEQSGVGGIITQARRGQIFFAVASYVGETVIKLYGGKWITDDKDPMGEVNITVKLDNGIMLFPAQRVVKRYQNGNEDSIYAYVYVLSQS